MTPDEPASGRTRFRPDVEGLRAVAIGTVLLFHAGLPWVRGGFVGVDVFFVISGFLITSLIVRDVERHGRMRMADFWARRARRLLPASTMVLVVAALITRLWLPMTQQRAFGGDIVSAALYVVNWRLAFRAVDYMQEGVGASPVQHFWSLAVEEQFYLLWPLLVAVAVLISRRRPRPVLAVLIAFLVIGSFAWAVHYSSVQPSMAFFVTTTRLWELGVGALLALMANRVAELPRWLRGALGWIGLFLILFAVFSYDEATAWPGLATLAPVLGAAAVIAGGLGSGRFGVRAVLGTRPMVFVGSLSYSLYLWHWPMVTLASAWGGR